MAPTCLDQALSRAEGGVRWGVRSARLPLLCLPATPEGFWLMPICLDGTYINHTLIESQVHSPVCMCLLVIALKLCELTFGLTRYKHLSQKLNKYITLTKSIRCENLFQKSKRNTVLHASICRVCHSVVYTGLSEVWLDLCTGMGDIMRKGVGGHCRVFRMFWHILSVSSGPSQRWFACHITTATLVGWFSS